ncbi:MAG TPA: hypothetical protein VI504_10355 [Candidatus Eisenbacteria bacterium]|jgi:hypothetical protein
MRLLAAFPTRVRHDGAVALFALATFALAGAGCTHHAYRDPAATVDESATGRLLGVSPGDLPTPIPGRKSELGSRARSSYPLAVGNRWDYAIHGQAVIITSAGPQPPGTFDEPWRAEIIGTLHVGARDYLLQQESNPEIVRPAGPVVSSAFRMRQDRDGLFELDTQFYPGGIGSEADGAAPLAAELSAYVERTVPDAGQRAAFLRAAARLASRVRWLQHGSLVAGADPGEITLLSYPLFIGARWIVRDSPRFARTVLAREHLLLPAGAFNAWRIRGTSELFGPTDRVTFWYAGAGLVRIRVHAESPATDETGNVIGRAVFDSDQRLTQVRLVDPGAPHTFAVAPLEPAGDE